jgi:hypothetical protein
LIALRSIITRQNAIMTPQTQLMGSHFRTGFGGGVTGGVGRPFLTGVKGLVTSTGTITIANEVVRWSLSGVAGLGFKDSDMSGLDWGESCWRFVRRRPPMHGMTQGPAKENARIFKFIQSGSKVWRFLVVCPTVPTF